MVDQSTKTTDQTKDFLLEIETSRPVYITGASGRLWTGMDGAGK
jgi:hypothetical protein